MIWVDVETTGIPEDGPIVPLEIGLMLTDKAGNEIDSFESVVIPRGWRLFIDEAKDIVKTMHEESGLLAKIESIELALGSEHANRIYGPKAIEAKILAWLSRHDIEDKSLPMTGSTVHFDRAVLLEFFPILHDGFHYRNQDVSSLKNFCKLYNSKVAARLPKLDNKAHRPLADIRASIKELQFYTENFLITEA